MGALAIYVRIECVIHVRTCSTCKMASGVDILLCTLVIISIFMVNKAQFISNDCIGLMINDPKVVVATNETHTYSSLWNIRGHFGILYRKQRVKTINAMNQKWLPREKTLNLEKVCLMAHVHY